METLVSDVGPGIVLQDRSCRIWHQDMVGGLYHPAASWILESCCSPSPSFQSIGQLATNCLQIWSILGSRARVSYSNLKRCVARLGTLASDCTEMVLGLTYVLGLVLGRRYDGCFHCYAGRRSSCPHRQRVRGLGDWARARMASEVVEGQGRRKASQSNVQHRYCLLPAMAVSGPSPGCWRQVPLFHARPGQARWPARGHSVLVRRAHLLLATWLPQPTTQYDRRMEIFCLHGFLN